LPEGRKTANICPNSGVIRRIPDKTRATIPADEAFRQLKEGNCPLVSG
jgi:hypothetical protein